ncbi:MAG: hypothetical protein AAFO69_19520, partial [Bacteroidota bacterium]
KRNLSGVHRWTLNVLIAFVLVWFAYFTAGYTSYIVGAVTFTVIGYLLLLFVMNKRKKNVFLLTNAGQKISTSKSEDLISKMEALF